MSDGDPITAAELARWMTRHVQAAEQTHRDLALLIERQDQRMDKSDDRMDGLATRITVIFAVVAVLWSIFLVIAPMVRGLIGIETG